MWAGPAAATPRPACGESYCRRKAELPVGPEVDLEEARAAALPTRDSLCPCCPVHSELGLAAVRTEKHLPLLPQASWCPPSHAARALQRGISPVGASTFPTKKMRGLDHSLGPNPAFVRVLSIAEVTFTYHVIHHVSPFQVQFSSS